MTETPKPRPSTPAALTSGIAMVMVGILLTLLANPFDGFVEGLLRGAGVVVILGGVVVISALLRRRADDESAEDAWLPSRDGDR